MLKLKPMLVLFICWSIVSWLACSTVSSVQRVLVGSAEELLSEDELRLRTPAARNHSHMFHIFTYFFKDQAYFGQIGQLKIVSFFVQNPPFYKLGAKQQQREAMCDNIGRYIAHLIFEVFENILYILHILHILQYLNISFHWNRQHTSVCPFWHF